MRTIVLLIIPLLAIVGCKDNVTGSKATPPLPYVATIDSISISDALLCQLADSSFKVPVGFYSEDLAGASIYYENTLSITPLKLRTGNASELSTNSREQAIAWSESSSVNSSYYRTLEAEKETDRYFEFRRVNPKYSNDIVLSRVHKLSYLDRSMFDSFHPTPLIARLNQRPVDTASVRSLCEYLWFTSYCQEYGAKALASVAAEQNGAVICALYYMQSVGNDWGQPRTGYLRRSFYSVDKATGDVTLSTTTIRSLQLLSN